MSDAIEMLEEGIEAFRKQEKDLKHNVNFLKGTCSELQEKREKLVGEIEALENKKKSAEQDLKVQYDNWIRKMEEKDKSLDDQQTLLASNVSAFDQVKREQDQKVVKVLAENEILKARIVSVETLGKQLEEKLAKHREMVDSLR
jgi:chromosome segregation ATPase